MPYKRKRKCVYKKNGKKVGCSKSVGKAKKYLKALAINVTNKEEDEEELLFDNFSKYYNGFCARLGIK